MVVREKYNSIQLFISFGPMIKKSWLLGRTKQEQRNHGVTMQPIDWLIWQFVCKVYKTNQAVISFQVHIYLLYFIKCDTEYFYNYYTK